MNNYCILASNSDKSITNLQNLNFFEGELTSALFIERDLVDLAPGPLATG